MTVQRFRGGVLSRGKGVGVPAREHLAKHGIARPLMEAWGPLLLWQSQTVVLALRQDDGKAGDFGNLAPANHARRVGRLL